MEEIKLTVSGPAGTRKILLKPKGMTLGRGANCDIALDDDGVSHVHARIFQDPFGRWVIEDLDSDAGVLVDGERVKAHAISAGHEIRISGFSMSLSEKAGGGGIGATTIGGPASIVDEGANEDIMSYKTEELSVLSPDLMKLLNEFTAEMVDLSSPSELYSQACTCLAGMLNTLVAIVRLPVSTEPLPVAPEVLACWFGTGEGRGSVLQQTSLRFSKRVLDAVRSEDKPVMASNWPSSGKNMYLTVIDKQRPHLVFAARVNELEDAVDALYVDILEIVSPKETFHFVEAAARQINFIQKNLFYNELKKQEEALREANTQLREKDRIKDEYVARVTHDIKGHLAAIQSCLYVSSSSSSGSLTDKQADFLGRAGRRTEQLTGFVKELLNLTQMRLSGRLEAKEFSLYDTIMAALETVGRKAEDKSITVSYDVDEDIGNIVGDEFSINEMITNLLFNAVKYTPEGKTIHLSAKSDDGEIRLDFTDTGIGIPEGEIENVFDEFFRASNAKKSEKDGTGLGLSIVKQIVERHDGRISVTSREGEGTTFTVTLPGNDQ